MFLKKLRDFDVTASIPVIALSADAFPSSIEAAMETWLFLLRDDTVQN